MRYSEVRCEKQKKYMKHMQIKLVIFSKMERGDMPDELWTHIWKGKKHMMTYMMALLSILDITGRIKHTVS